MSNFRQFDRATGFLLPPSLDEWLPEQHLARFVVEVIDGLDLLAMVKSYRGSGSASYHPALLLGLLVYGYTMGGFEPQAGTCDLRFGSVPLYRRERSSRPRHHRNAGGGFEQCYNAPAVVATTVEPIFMGTVVPTTRKHVSEARTAALHRWAPWATLQPAKRMGAHLGARAHGETATPFP